MFQGWQGGEEGRWEHERSSMSESVCTHIGEFDRIWESGRVEYFHVDTVVSS